MTEVLSNMGHAQDFVDTTHDTLDDDYAIAFALQQEEYRDQKTYMDSRAMPAFSYSETRQHDEDHDSDSDEDDFDDADEYDYTHAAKMNHGGVLLTKDENPHRAYNMVVHESLLDSAEDASRKHLARFSKKKVDKDVMVAKPYIGRGHNSANQPDQDSDHEHEQRASSRKNSNVARVQDKRNSDKGLLLLTLKNNACQCQTRSLRFDPTLHTTIKAVLRLASQRYNFRGKKAFRRLFRADGSEIVSVDQIDNNTTLLVSAGEPFVG